MFRFFHPIVAKGEGKEHMQTVALIYLVISLALVLIGALAAMLHMLSGDLGTTAQWLGAIFLVQAILLVVWIFLGIQQGASWVSPNV